MSRDSKSKSHGKARGGTLLGMFIGLVLGVCLAAGVVWYMNRANSPFATMPKPAQPAVTPVVANGKPATAQTPAAGQPLPLPGKPGDPVPKERFDFYKILPGEKEAVPEDKGDAKKADTKKEDGKEAKKDDAKKDDKEAKADGKKDEAKKDEAKQPVFLQVGSFASAQDADNQKAKLALMGMEASVLQVMVQEKTFYRVRLGPYNKPEEANKIRAELAKSGIDVSLSKKEP